MAYCQISHLCFSPFWTQLSFQISTQTLHSFLYPTHTCKICFTPTLPGPVSHQSQFIEAPGFILLLDSLEFTVVSYHLPKSPFCLDNNSQVWDSPRTPSPHAPRLPVSTRESTKQMGCTSYSCFLMSTRPQTLH